ncbi:hypothetical protein PM082_000185 [Marasmius tenuissimus]|nr:hypothetical protein PM082_000185 [Marasmius tenuissimus]
MRPEKHRNFGRDASVTVQKPCIDEWDSRGRPPLVTNRDPKGSQFLFPPRSSPDTRRGEGKNWLSILPYIKCFYHKEITIGALQEWRKENSKKNSNIQQSSEVQVRYIIKGTYIMYYQCLIQWFVLDPYLKCSQSSALRSDFENHGQIFIL